jgi:hypothetical protein
MSELKMHAAKMLSLGARNEISFLVIIMLYPLVVYFHKESEAFGFSVFLLQSPFSDLSLFLSAIPVPLIKLAERDFEYSAKL